MDGTALSGTDGGRTWEPLGFKLGGREALSSIAVHPDDPDTVYAATFGTDLFRSRDRGHTWQPLGPERS